MVGNLRRIVVNATNLRMGGALQVLEYFLLSCQKWEIEIALLCSDDVGDKLRHVLIGSNLVVFSAKRPKNLMATARSYRAYDQFIDEFKPCLIFTLFGPSHWVPSRAFLHVVGFANALHVDRDALSRLEMNFFEKNWLRLKTLYFKRRLLSQADRFIVQTSRMREGVCRWLELDARDIAVVPNGSGLSGRSAGLRSSAFSELPRVLNFGFAGNLHKHKNHKFLLEYSRFLTKNGVRNMVHVTLTDDECKRLNVSDQDSLKNWGRISSSRLIQFYDSLDLVLFPSMIESFSAVLPESVHVGKPLLLPALAFNTELAEQSAFYYTNNSVESAYRETKKIFDGSGKTFQKLQNAHGGAIGLRAQEVMFRYQAAILKFWSDSCDDRTH